jgi:hypothetical protein
MLRFLYFFVTYKKTYKTAKNDSRRKNLGKKLEMPVFDRLVIFKTGKFKMPVFWQKVADLCQIFGEIFPDKKS